MCGFSDNDVSRFIHFLKKDPERPITICQGTTVVGLQRCQKVWVINASTHFDEFGKLISDSSSPYKWTPECISYHCKQVSLAELNAGHV